MLKRDCGYSNCPLDADEIIRGTVRHGAETTPAAKQIDKVAAQSARRVVSDSCGGSASF